MAPEFRVRRDHVGVLGHVLGEERIIELCDGGLHHVEFDVVIAHALSLLVRARERRF